MSKAKTGTQSGRILLVDDNTGNLRVLENLLTGQGYTVHPASDGKLALRFVQEILPDLILLDIRMPGMDGHEICRRLKADERTRSIPVIFISVLEQERDKVKGFQEGAVDYITKPFQPEEVLARVRTHLRLRELTERLEQTVADRTEELMIVNQQLQQELAERKRAVEALREREEFLSSIVENIPDMVFIKDAKDLRFVRFNNAGEKLLGYRRDDLIGKSDYDFFPKEQADSFAKKDMEVLNSGQVYEVPEEPIDTRTGRRILHTKKIPLLDKAGRPTHLLGVSEDITERKLAEERLRKSEERFRAVFENAAIGIYVVDSEGRLRQVNRSFAEMLGYTQHELLDKTIFDLSPHDDVEVFRIKHVNMVHGETACYRFEERYIRNSGEILWADVSMSPVRGPDGVYEATVGVVSDITERKQAEERLRLLDFALHHVREAAFLIDEHARFRFVNEESCRILGYTRPELLGLSVPDVEPGFPLDRWPEHWNSLKKQGSLRFESRHRTRDGHIFSVEVNANYFEFGGQGYNLALVRDITERKTAERERLASLRFLESMERVNKAIQGTDDLEQMMSDVLDVVLSTFDCDRAYLGYPCDPQGASWTMPMERTKPEYPGVLALGLEMPMDAEVANECRACLHSDGPVLTGPGTDYPIPKSVEEGFGVKSAMVMAFFPRLGKPWRFGIHQCSFPRNWTPEESRLFQEIGRRLADGLSTLLAYRNLRESEQKYRTLFEESIDGVYSATRDGELTDANQSFCDIFGYTREEMIRKNAKELFLNPDDRTKVFKEIEERGFIKDSEVIYKKKDGTPIVGLLSTSTYLAKDGTVAGYRGILRDLTAYKALQKQLLQAQKMESLGTLAGGIAHDFNNLLQVIIGYSDMLLFNKKRSDMEYEGLQAIRQAGRDGAELAKRILAFSRRLEPDARPTDLNNEIVRVQKMLERTVSKLIRLEILLADNLQTVNADPSQMEQILLNLAVNAQYAMPDGGRLTIETANVTLDEDYSRTHLDVEPGRYVLISVSDTGHGMDKDVLEHIFEPFYTTKGVDEGTGLGLAMVFGIVKSHKGHITCYSEPGVGTTFKIYLPAIVLEIEPDAAATEQMPACGTETILLVDDEKSICELVEWMLRMAGYTVLTANNGREALEIYRSNQDRIALVLLDLMMPEMGGKQCMEELLEIDKRVEVIIASGYSADGPTKDALAAGAKRFVDKPYDMRQVLEAIREVLDAE